MLCDALTPRAWSPDGAFYQSLGISVYKESSSNDGTGDESDGQATEEEGNKRERNRGQQEGERYFQKRSQSDNSLDVISSFQDSRVKNHMSTGKCPKWQRSDAALSLAWHLGECVGSRWWWWWWGGGRAGEVGGACYKKNMRLKRQF